MKEKESRVVDLEKDHALLQLRFDQVTEELEKKEDILRQKVDQLAELQETQKDLTLTLKQKEEVLCTLQSEQENMQEEHSHLMQTTMSLNQKYHESKLKLTKSAKKLK